MKLSWSGTIDGTFRGYKPGQVYILSDGSTWRQQGGPAEYVYRESPGARLLRDDTGRTFLDVEGTSSVVPVVRPAGTSGAEVY